VNKRGRIKFQCLKGQQIQNLFFLRSFYTRPHIRKKDVKIFKFLEKLFEPKNLLKKIYLENKVLDGIVNQY